MPPIHIWQVITVLFAAALTTAVPAEAYAMDDKILHLGAGAGLGAAGYGATAIFSNSAWLRATGGMALGAAAGGIKEWADKNNHGESSPTDFLATFAGAALTTGILLIWDHLSPYKDREKTIKGSLPSRSNHETAAQTLYLKKLIRTETNHAFALSERIPGHAFQTGPTIHSGISTSPGNSAFYRSRRTFSKYQLFLH